MNIALIILFLLLPAGNNSFALSTPTIEQSEINNEVQVCANYQTQDGWSEGYVVNAEILEGSELNERTDTFNYVSYSHYAVIFWDYGQASIIKLQLYFGSIGYTPTEGTDQSGRKWKLSTATYMCN